MKKSLFLLPGVIAVMFTAAPMMGALNNPAFADDAPQAGKHHGEWDKLGLNDTQKSQIKQIRQDAQQKMDAILTSDQKTQLQQARSQHTRPKLALSDDQKAQMKQIHQDSENQIMQVLTPAQQQQYKQILAKRQQRHQQRSN
ncbi:MAG: P pilus assembly/Cpx signaling pathway, periplasmic inhibitor/zinc-resistance associated protein [Rhizonema sp. NSF051]|nr:P pilus assembly/Cpx signaling pathway, periplasmic inhibitor/zinc-resistance associated protein [Rhizonema sp. NSF051]